jgi:hypothetical protein
VILSAAGIGQDISQIEFINELDGRSVATYADALRMFRFQVRTIPGSGSYLLKGYYDDLKLTKGTASLMIARYLKLKQSLMYRIFDIERYAYRACLAEKFFSIDGSENDLMSGSELIELFTKIDEFKGRR